LELADNYPDNPIHKLLLADEEFNKFKARYSVVA
jgi:hypothetical protein